MALARNRLLETIVRKGGSRLLDMAIARAFPVAKKAAEAATEVAADIPEPKPKLSLARGVAGAAVTHIATRSVPGAILIGGGIIAKKLYDRRRAKGRNGRS